LINFAVLIIEIVNKRLNTKAGNHLSGQMVRSGTSPASKENDELISIFVKRVETAQKIGIDEVFTSKINQKSLIVNPCSEIKTDRMASA